MESRRNRNSLIVIGAAVLYIIIGNIIGFFTVTALIVFWFALEQLRNGDKKTGKLLLGAGLFMLVLEHFVLVLLLLAAIWIYFYMKPSDANETANFMQKHNVIYSLKKNQDQYVLQNMNVSALVSDINLDLSFALFEEEETTLVFQGIVGDVKVIVPAELGICVETHVWFGETKIDREGEAGVFNRVLWRSPNYDRSDQKVKIYCTFVAGEVDVRIL